MKKAIISVGMCPLNPPTRSPLKIFRSPEKNLVPLSSICHLLLRVDHFTWEGPRNNGDFEKYPVRPLVPPPLKKQRSCMQPLAKKLTACWLRQKRHVTWKKKNHAYTKKEKIILVHELIKQTKFMPIQNHPSLLRSQMVHRLEGGKQSTWVLVILQELWLLFWPKYHTLEPKLVLSDPPTLRESLHSQMEYDLFVMSI